MSFLKKVKSSVYDPLYYSEILNMNFGGSLKYFFKLSLLLALVGAVYLSFVSIPKVNSFISTFGDRVVDAYPAELEVRLKNGLVSTNVVEPYIIPLPKDDFNSEYSKSNYENLIVIDTKSDLSLDKFNAYNTVVLLTKNAVLTRDKGKITITELKGTSDLTINRDKLVYWVGKVTPFVKKLPYIIPVIVFTGLFLYFAFSLFYLLFVALLVFIIGKIRKLGLSYKKSYQISLHAITLPLILSTVSLFINIKMFRFVPTIILLVVVWVNLKAKDPVLPLA